MGPVTVVVLVGGVLAYLVVGVFVFMALEAGAEIRRQTALLATLQQFLDKHRCLDREKMMALMNYIDRDLDTARYVLHHNVTYNVMWDWSGAASFVVSVITTIGYGHITPRTAGGKVACMVYAMGGIPLLLLLLKGAGEMLCRLGGRCLTLACRCSPHRPALHRLHAILQSVVGVVILFALPVTVNIYQEGWSLLDSVYSYFITLTTIGFGDFVAGNPADRESFEQSTGMLTYRLVNLLWTLLGLAYLSMLITAISNCYLHHTRGVKAQAERSVRRLRRRVGQKLDCRESSCSMSTQTDDTPSPSPSSPSSSTLSLAPLRLSGSVAADVQVRLLAFSALSADTPPHPPPPATPTPVSRGPVSGRDLSAEVKDGSRSRGQRRNGSAKSQPEVAGKSAPPRKVSVSTITWSNGVTHT